MVNSKIKPFINNFSFLIMSALINISAAFLNKYILLVPASAGYIHSGMTTTLSRDQSIVYSLFIKYFSFGTSLWLVIFIQGLILSYVIYSFFTLLEIKRPERFTLIASIVLSSFTGVSVYCSEILPDIFTPLFILIIPIILFSHRNTFTNITLILIFILAVTTDINHLAISFITFSVFILFYFIFIHKKYRLKKGKLIQGLISILFCFFFIPFIHFIIGGEFYTTKTSHAFFMARMAENGILNKFLEDNCNNTNYKLCAFKENLSLNLSQFLWDENSPIYKTDGWYDKDGEYKEIIRETFLNWKYLSLHIQESVKETFAQLFSFEIGEGIDNIDGNDEFKKFFPNEYNEYFNSRQNSHLIDYSFLNEMQHLILIISLLGLLMVFFIQFQTHKLNYLQLQVTVFIMISLLINAFICGSLFGAYWRYQGRVIWLLPLLFIGLFNLNRENIKAYFRMSRIY